MVTNQLIQRWFIQLREDVAQLLAVGTAFCKSAALADPQRADWRVTVLAADLAVFVAMPGINCHGNHLPEARCVALDYRRRNDNGSGATWRGRPTRTTDCRPASSENEATSASFRSNNYGWP
jgi:hypothetical protein